MCFLIVKRCIHENNSFKTPNCTNRINNFHHIRAFIYFKVLYQYARDKQNIYLSNNWGGCRFLRQRIVYPPPQILYGNVEYNIFETPSYGLHPKPPFTPHRIANSLTKIYFTPPTTNKNFHLPFFNGIALMDDSVFTRLARHISFHWETCQSFLGHDFLCTLIWNLRPVTCYLFKMSSCDRGGWITQFAFKSLPPPHENATCFPSLFIDGTALFLWYSSIPLKSVGE